MKTIKWDPYDLGICVPIPPKLVFPLVQCGICDLNCIVSSRNRAHYIMDTKEAERRLQCTFSSKQKNALNQLSIILNTDGPTCKESLTRIGCGPLPPDKRLVRQQAALTQLQGEHMRGTIYLPGRQATLHTWLSKQHAAIDNAGLCNTRNAK